MDNGGNKKLINRNFISNRSRICSSMLSGLMITLKSFLGIFYYLMLKCFSGFIYLGKGLWRGIKFYCYDIFYHILKLCVRPFLRIKVKGKNNIRKTDEARIFIANHLEVYGPVLCYLHLPVRKKRFWIIDKMLDPNFAEQQMSYAVQDPNNFRWAPKWLRNMVVKSLRGIVSYVLTNKAKGISVSRDDSRKMMQTFKETMTAVQKKYNIVIFPEIKYQERGFSDMYEGFITFGKYLYKKTGKICSFYPVYIDKFSKVMNIGKPIDFTPQQADEIKTISTYITKTINGFC